MKKIVIKLLALLLILLVLPSVSDAQRITREQALQVAGNWITLMGYFESGWEATEGTKVERTDDLFVRGRRVGYYCDVEPDGFIMISLYKGLAPVKAFETTGHLKADDELLLYLKDCMKNVIDNVENSLGPIDKLSCQELTSILEIDYNPAWDKLDVSKEQFARQLTSGHLDNYEEGEILTLSKWNQTWPFNMYCPDLGCAAANYNGHAAAGCGPIAASQVMRYWNWPPFHDGDLYDWTHMPHWFDNTSTPADTHWVAKLIHEVGISAGADYGCAGEGGTSTFFAGWPGADIEDTFKEHFLYSQDVDAAYRRNHATANGWFDLLKEQLNLNRPLPYCNTDHLFVCDGWKEIYVMGILIKYYHMNWGHGGSQTDWYALDAIPDPNQTTEGALTGVHPLNSIGPFMDPVYPKDLSFFYRYFDMDAVGITTFFSPGQRIQFLHNIVVMGVGFDPYNYITFDGVNNDPTYLFSQGDMTKGAKINNGQITLRAGGSIQFKQYNY